MSVELRMMLHRIAVKYRQFHTDPAGVQFWRSMIISFQNGKLLVI